MLLPQRLDLHEAHLTTSERALSDSMRQCYPNGLLDSASVMAAAVGTSASTVVRFFAKLGYPSLAEVRREARSQVTKMLEKPSQRTRATIGGQRSLMECIDDARMHDQHNLQATYDGLDAEAFESFVDAICHCKGRVLVAAGIKSLPVSMFLATHLGMCRPQVYEFSSVAPSNVDRLLWVGPEDVLVVFSIRRYAADSVQAAQHVHAQGGRVLAITDSPASPVLPFAQHWLRVETGNASPFDSYTSAISLCNALISAVAQVLRDNVEQTLRKCDAMWAQLPTETTFPSASSNARAKRKAR